MTEPFQDYHGDNSRFLRENGYTPFYAASASFYLLSRSEEWAAVGPTHIMCRHQHPSREEAEKCWASIRGDIEKLGEVNHEEPTVQAMWVKDLKGEQP